VLGIENKLKEAFQKQGEENGGGPADEFLLR